MMIMKLYKFRSLLDCSSLERVANILETGEFWCSPLWEQNDPMEAVYIDRRKFGPDGDLPDLFNQKNEYRICSFSSKKALKNPLMWGYYAGGFKGVVIEIEAPEGGDLGAQIVDYKNELPEIHGDEDAIRKVLTTKLKRWKHEAEYRFLLKGPTASIKLGTIKAVYFGKPYGSVENHTQVVGASETLKKYYERIEKLQKIAQKKQYGSYSAYVSGDGKVLIEPPEQRTKP